MVHYRLGLSGAQHAHAGAVGAFGDLLTAIAAFSMVHMLFSRADSVLVSVCPAVRTARSSLADNDTPTVRIMDGEEGEERSGQRD